MRKCVLGVGYVGLVVGLSLSDRGFGLGDMDTNTRKLKGPQLEKMPIDESEQDEIAERNIQGDCLLLSGDKTDTIVANLEPEPLKGIMGLSAAHISAIQALNHAYTVILVMESRQFQQPSRWKVKERMHQPVFYDRNLYSLNTLYQTGFSYDEISRRS